MKFKYIGPEASTSIFGYEFPRGEPVEVRDDHAHAIGKLKNMTTLFEQSDKAGAPAAPKPSKKNDAAQ